MFPRYKYETSVSHSKDLNSTESILPCMSNHSMTDAHETNDLKTRTGTYIQTKILSVQGNTFIGEEDKQCCRKNIQKYCILSTIAVHSLSRVFPL